MNTRNLLTGAAIATLGVGLIALPSASATKTWAQDDCKLQDKLQSVQSKMDSATRAYEAALQQVQDRVRVIDELPEVQDFSVLLGDEENRWLGVETKEVSSDFAKEHKPPAERGVVLGKVISDSPAAKAGLKENDVITEVNGQRVEGTAQFRRMIREIPAGRK